jgi:hypothetical protein
MFALFGFLISLLGVSFITAEPVSASLPAVP